MNQGDNYRKATYYDSYVGLSVKRLAKKYEKSDEKERILINHYVYNSGRKSNRFKAEFRAILTLKPDQKGYYQGFYTGREALPPEFRREKRKELESKTD